MLLFLSRLVGNNFLIDNARLLGYHWLETAPEMLKPSRKCKVENSDSAISKLAKELKKQHRQLKTSTFLSLLVTADIIYRYLDNTRDEKQISGPAFNVLNTLILCKGSAFPTEISRRIFRSKHSVSKVIFTLEKHGLVTVRPAGNDRRKREVTITDKGIEVTKKGTIYFRKLVGEKIFTILTDEETRFLNGILTRIRRHTLSLVNSDSH
jgi:DNA-binding MarR family transcriptional regulator